MRKLRHKRGTVRDTNIHNGCVVMSRDRSWKDVGLASLQRNAERLENSGGGRVKRMVHYTSCRAVSILELDRNTTGFCFGAVFEATCASSVHPHEH